MSGHLFIITAPSGAGKTTLVSRLLERDPTVRLSVSFTTRDPRPGEVQGRHYHFVGRPDFERRRDAGEFLEWAEVHGNFYGTSRAWIGEQIFAGHDVVLEIDWQGARQVRRAFPAAIGVFVLPPTMAELERRLRGRGKDEESVVRRRLDAAEAEIRHVGEFNYVIINNDLHEAVDDFTAIVRASRLKLGARLGAVADVLQSR